jgi:hypothetical protein
MNQLPEKSVRFIFEVDGEEDIKLRYQKIIPTIAHDFQQVQTEEGYYIESLDSSDNVLHSYYIYRAFPTHVESHRVGEGVRNLPLADRKGAFTILVPYVPELAGIRIVKKKLREPFMFSLEPGLLPNELVSYTLAKFPLTVSE